MDTLYRTADTAPRHAPRGISRQSRRESRSSQNTRTLTENTLERAREMVDSVYREDSRRVFATLIRLLGDFDVAEDALHDAFAAALEQWPQEGIPRNPRAWLVSTGRFRAIDGMRRRARFDASLPVLAERLETNMLDYWVDDGVEDDRLRLILTCCHPALSPQARLALTLREVCGLATDEVASAFLNTVQAAIAAVHAEAQTSPSTDWAQIVALYDVLLQMALSPVVTLNRAVAVAMTAGPDTGLVLIDALLANGELIDYHLAHAARAELCRQCGRTSEARLSYERALRLTKQEPERRFLERRLAELPG